MSVTRTIRPAPSTAPPRRLMPDHEAPAPRQVVPYRCGRDHEFSVTFASGIEPPTTRECRCGSAAVLAPSAGEVPAAPAAAAGDGGQAREEAGSAAERKRCVRLLLERRSRAELERLLSGRLAELAATRGPSGGVV